MVIAMTDYSKASYRELIAINDLLRQVVHTMENGVVYEQGWTDDKVAAQIGCKTNWVSNARRKLFGNFQKVKKPEPTTLRSEIEEIKDYLTTLREALVKQVERYKILDDRMARLEGKMQIAFPNYDPKDSVSPLAVVK
jgi:hypothetical protein